MRKQNLWQKHSLLEWLSNSSKTFLHRGKQADLLHFLFQSPFRFTQVSQLLSTWTSHTAFQRLCMHHLNYTPPVTCWPVKIPVLFSRISLCTKGDPHRVVWTQPLSFDFFSSWRCESQILLQGASNQISWCFARPLSLLPALLSFLVFFVRSYLGVHKGNEFIPPLFSFLQLSQCIVQKTGFWTCGELGDYPLFCGVHIWRFIFCFVWVWKAFLNH